MASCSLLLCLSFHPTRCDERAELSNESVKLDVTVDQNYATCLCFPILEKVFLTHIPRNCYVTNAKKWTAKLVKII